MQSKIAKLSTVLLFWVSFNSLYAQQNQLTSGGNAIGNGGSLSYSIGQLAFNSLTGTSGNLIQGNQQPFEISIITGVDDLIGLEYSISVYPNPSTTNLSLNIENFQNENLNYQLFNINGQLIDNQKIVTGETAIDMKNLIPATYLLIIIRQETPIKTFKIIKR
jgi:hypothetical protein